MRDRIKSVSLKDASLTAYVKISNVDTLADLIDRLIVELLKLSVFENRKREEHAKSMPDYILISELDNLSRDCCELRSALKNEINKTFEEIVRTGEYKVLKEPRTFRPSSNNVWSVLVKMVEERTRSIHHDALVEAIKNDLDNGRRAFRYYAFIKNFLSSWFRYRGAK